MLSGAFFMIVLHNMVFERVTGLTVIFTLLGVLALLVTAL